MFTLSIETTCRNYQHPFHLGTIEHVARTCAEEIFRRQRPEPIVTVALIRDRKIFDVFDGTWFNDTVNRMLEAQAQDM